MENFALNIAIVKILNGWAVSSLYVSNLVIFAAYYLGFVMILVLPVYIWRSRRRLSAIRIVLLAVASGLLAYYLSDLIKSSWPVARPSELSGIKALLQPGDVSAFPSGHASFFGALALAVFFHNRYWGGWLIAMAILISAARVAAGVHFPLDIVAGWILAFGSAVVFLWVGKKLTT
ncbi:MAG: phosphatase PAP2 family protein [Candidatus Vogelbacteria bacterium]|nr:phosphatase PAP2 family protein [Candidatus Vogelbacteria bacterium]